MPFFRRAVCRSFERELARVAETRITEVGTSSLTGEGLEVWAGRLADQVAAVKESAEGARF